MHNSHSQLPLTRREFLKYSGSGLGLLAFSSFAPAFLTQSALAKAPAPEKDRTILVLVQLAGGNDGLNTLVPYANDYYHKLRPTLGLKKEEILALNDEYGLHPSLSSLHSLYDEGKVSIIQNVGYPNPNKSHFRSAEIWETATGSDEFSSTGWIGRYLDNACSGQPGEDPAALGLGSELPQAFLAEQSHRLFITPPGRPGRSRQSASRELLEKLTHAPAQGDSIEFLQQTMMDTLVTEDRVQLMLRNDKTEADYPRTILGNSLRNIAALIGAGLETRVYFATQGGYDTHVNQVGTHARLLKQLSEALTAFQADLEHRGLDQQVLLMTFSEFGRRPQENAGQGTDHGTAAPLFVMGSQVKGGLIGTGALLDIEPNHDIQYSTDFRQIYATVLENWLQHPSDKILGEQFSKLPFC